MGEYLYSSNVASILLLPLSGIYWLLHNLHKLVFKYGILKVQKVAAPVIVVGNITVGGTGKTPLVAWLCNHLLSNGYHPGIISRGYKGRSAEPQCVYPDSDPEIAGDEPVLLVAKTGVPVYISPNRVEAAKKLLAENQCDVLISDDGLQHYRMHRDIEIAVIDGRRRFGNGFLLPAGPMRESKKRLAGVDWVLCRGGNPENGELAYSYIADNLRNLKSGEKVATHYFIGKKVHAVAGIGNPQQYFDQLARLGYIVEKHSFPDHFRFRAKDLDFPGSQPIIMTEKDAVKCRHLVDAVKHDIWYLSIEAQVPKSFESEILKKLNEVISHG